MALGMSSSLTVERLARWREDLTEAGPSPNVDESAVVGAQARAAGRPAAELRQELRRLKFVFTAAEAQRLFAEKSQERCFEQDPPFGHGARSASGRAAGEARRQGAKERNKGTKRELARAQEAHDQLVRDVAEARQGVFLLRNKCLTDISEAADLLEFEASELDMDVDAGVGATGHDAQAAGDAQRFSEDASRLRLSLAESSAERRQLEEALRGMEAQRKSAKAAAAELLQRAERERVVAASYEKLQQAEHQLGLPQAEVNLARSVAVLGAPDASVLVEAFINGTSATEAERTLQLGFGEDGRLQHAEPHPVLGLQKEAEEAVARDDLARLVTLSWDRICKGPEERQLLKAARSRAEFDQSMMSARHGGA